MLEGIVTIFLLLFTNLWSKIILWHGRSMGWVPGCITPNDGTLAHGIFVAEGVFKKTTEAGSSDLPFPSF